MAATKTDELALKISTSALETTAPADIAFAALGLALGAAIDADHFPGGLATDAVATFTSSGAIGIAYGVRAIAVWLAAVRKVRDREMKLVDETRRELGDLYRKAYGLAEQIDAEPNSLRTELRTLLKDGVLSREDEDRLRDVVAKLSPRPQRAIKFEDV